MTRVQTLARKVDRILEESEILKGGEGLEDGGQSKAVS